MVLSEVGFSSQNGLKNDAKQDNIVIQVQENDLKKNLQS